MPEILAKAASIYLFAIVVSLAIAGLIKAIVVLLGAVAREAAPSAAEPAPQAPAADIEADHVAAIAAAVYSVIGAHRILHIEDVQRGRGWVVEGRLAHHASHSLGHHPRR